MVLLRGKLNPLCRQCGHAFERSAARCPMCGMRSGLVEPLRKPARKAMDERPAAVEVVDLDELADLESDADDLVLAPPIERPVVSPLFSEPTSEPADRAGSDDEAAPIARSVSLGSLMIGTMLIAACLGLGRVSMSAGVIAFLVLVPAYIRTLSAISYYRRRDRQLGGHDIAPIFATSLVLSLMGLFAGGLVFLVTSFACGLIAGVAGWDPDPFTAIVGTAAAFVTVLVLVHKVWPVNED